MRGAHIFAGMRSTLSSTLHDPIDTDNADDNDDDDFDDAIMERLTQASMLMHMHFGTL